MKNFYITTTLPYVNADPHIGFALEIIQADAIARYKKISGYDVCFNFGTDEHGLKIYRKAQETHKTPQAFCDEYARKFSLLKDALNLSYTNFVRTTDKYHIEAAREFWLRCLANGDIYKKNYAIKYCVGCELEKTDSELINGLCPIHPNLKLEIIDEENYFFRFSKYQKPLLSLYEKNPSFVLPKIRLNEIYKFVKQGLEDFSISRLKTKMPWGIEVPNDSDHVMYVWFDALINYVSTIGWPKNQKQFSKWWPVTQIAGKDNLRQQSAMWQAMLLSANLPNSQQILIHGFITSDGRKMSKSLGNVVNPFDLVKKYGTDPIRYYLLSEIPTFDDGNFSEKIFKEIYNADLANGLGNLIARVAKLSQNLQFKFDKPEFSPEFIKILNNFELNKGMTLIWNKIRNLDLYINHHEPWKIKDNLELAKILQPAVAQILNIAFELQPFLPVTSQKILAQFLASKITVQPPLFPRLN